MHRLATAHSRPLDLSIRTHTSVDFPLDGRVVRHAIMLPLREPSDYTTKAILTIDVFTIFTRAWPLSSYSFYAYKHAALEWRDARCRWSAYFRKDTKGKPLSIPPQLIELYANQPATCRLPPDHVQRTLVATQRAPTNTQYLVLHNGLIFLVQRANLVLVTLNTNQP